MESRVTDGGPKESNVYKTKNATATSWQKERLKWRTDAFLIRTWQRETQILRIPQLPGRFHIPNHSWDRNVSARASPCPHSSQLGTRASPLFPFPALAGQGPSRTPRSPPRAGPTCQNRSQAVGCQPRAVTFSQNHESRGAEERAGDSLNWPFRA
nr:uncharacterized protein LOC131766964 isoform X2 [Kogia breviceps]